LIIVLYFFSYYALVATPQTVIMARSASAKQTKKRSRDSKPYENKSKIVALLGFDTEASFDKWRASSLVKPWWDLFVTRFLETDLFVAGGKVADFTNLCNWIREGEKGGKRRFRKARDAPNYDNELDWHAWLTFWIVEENVTDREGRFYDLHMDHTLMYKNAYHFIVWAKRQRQRDSKAAASAKSPKSAHKQPIARQELASSEDESNVEEADMDPNGGTAIVRWTEGMPDALEEQGHDDRITVESFCGYTLLDFWREVDTRFELSTHLQRRSELASKGNLTFRAAQLQAHVTGKTIIFYLRTEDATLSEEAQHVPLAGIPIPEDVNDDLEADNREMKYREMVDEAASAGATTFDMKFRLWQYNLLLAEAKEGDHVTIRDVDLDLGDGTDTEFVDDFADEQAIQVSRSHVLCGIQPH
jgi:hypothetical protein